MNRQDLIRRVMLQEAMAAELAKRARADRDLLAADARAEFEKHGTAPTWRLPDLATVTLPVSKDTITVRDGAEFTAWVQRVRPEEIVPTVNPAFQMALMASLRIDGGRVIDADGTEIPGLAVRVGGQPKSLSLRAAPDAQAVLADAATVLVDRLQLDGPITLAEPRQ